MKATHTGSTLMEIMIFLAVTLGVMTVGTLTLRDLQLKQIEARTIRQIVTALRLARIESLKRQSTISLHLTQSQLIIDSLPTKIISLPSPIEACQPLNLQLWQRGTASVDSFCIKSPSMRCKIIISLRGRVRVECK